MGGSCRDEVSLLKEICRSGRQQHLHIIIVPQSLPLSEVAPFPTISHCRCGGVMWDLQAAHARFPGSAQSTMPAV